MNHQIFSTHHGYEQLRLSLEIHRLENELRNIETMAHSLKMGPAATANRKPEWRIRAATAREPMQPTHC